MEDDTAAFHWLSLAVGARGVRHVRHDGKFKVKIKKDFRPPFVWNGVCNCVVLGNLEVIRIQLVH